MLFSAAPADEAASVNIPLGLGFESVIARKTSTVRRVDLRGLAPGDRFEAWFETDFRVDSPWFGVYLYSGRDRFSFRQTRQFAGGCWSSSPASRSGFTRVRYAGRVPAAGRLDLNFVCDYADVQEPPSLDDIRALGRRPHPRLMIGDPGVFARIRAAASTNEVLAASLDHLRRYADQEIGTPVYAYSPDGRRLWAQPVIARVFGLGQAWKIFGERKYLERLERELRSVAAFPNWNEPHFIDTGLFTAALAVAYDWYYDDWSEEMRGVIADAIVRHGLEKAEPDAFWIHNGNNWSQVCHAGMAMGAIAVAERCPELAHRLVRDAVVTYHEAFDAYAPNGSFPEGPGYWHLATIWSVIAIESFRSALGSDYGLADLPGFKRGPKFIEAMTGPSGRLYNFGDCGSQRNPHPEVWWFAREAGRPELVTQVERDKTIAMMRGPVEANDFSRNECFVPLIWMADVPDPGKRPDEWVRSWTSGECTVPVVMMASPVGTNASDRLWVAMKGGSASLSHAHADLGSFVFEMLGERWAEDVSGGGYGSGEKKFGMDFWKNDTLDSPRWSIFSLGPQGHNVVTADKFNPNVIAYAALKSFSGDEKSGRSAEFDMSSVYPLARKGATRRMEVPGGLPIPAWRVVDEFRGVPPGTEFTWRMNTYADASVEGDTVHLSKNGKNISLQSDSGRWRVASPFLSGETSDRNLSQIQLSVRAESEDVVIRVSFSSIRAAWQALQ